MALMKEYEYGNKKGNYWKIIGVYPDTAYRNTIVKVALYTNHGSRIKDDGSYVMSGQYSLPGLMDQKADLYNLLKKLPQFENCKDI